MLVIPCLVPLVFPSLVVPLVVDLSLVAPLVVPWLGIPSLVVLSLIVPLVVDSSLVVR